MPAVSKASKENGLFLLSLFCVRGVFEIFDFCRPRAVLTEQLVISADDLLDSEIRLRRIATYAAEFASSPVFIDMTD